MIGDKKSPPKRIRIDVLETVVRQLRETVDAVRRTSDWTRPMSQLLNLWTLRQVPAGWSGNRRPQILMCSFPWLSLWRVWRPSPGDAPSSYPDRCVEALD